VIRDDGALARAVVPPSLFFYSHLSREKFRTAAVKPLRHNLRGCAKDPLRTSIERHQRRKRQRGGGLALVCLQIDIEVAASAEHPDRPSIFTALEEQLGLRLESTRGLLDVLVVDAVSLPMPD
jgi:hypothetical protein